MRIFSGRILYMSVLQIILAVVLGGYLCMNAYLYIFQRNILYLPAKEMLSPQNYGFYEASEVILTTRDNLKIIAWYMPPKKGQDLMIYYHGNAGNLADREEKMKIFASKGFGILALSYRGFGKSEGIPTEDGLYIDARAAIEYALAQGIKLEKIFLYGESLGSGVAVQMATEYRIKAVILEAPYTSIANRAQELYPYIPVKLLLKDHFRSIDKIGRINAPVLILHGYRDEVMPISHGRRMLEAAQEPKEARLFEKTGHTDFDLEEISNYTRDFVGRF